RLQFQGMGLRSPWGGTFITIETSPPAHLQGIAPVKPLALVIGNKNYSSWSLRPWLVLRQAGIPFDEVLIPLYRPDSAAALAKWSPSGKVPALHDGDIRVWDSLAICEYLAERFPDKEL